MASGMGESDGSDKSDKSDKAVSMLRYSSSPNLPSSRAVLASM